MIIVLIPMLACKSQNEKERREFPSWIEVLSEDLDSWTGAEGSRFGAGLTNSNGQLWITAPQDCNHTLYTISDDTLSGVGGFDRCDQQQGHHIVNGSNTIWVYSPLPSPSWSSLNGSLVEGRRIEWTNEQLYIGHDTLITAGDEQSWSTEFSIQDMTVHDESIVALLNDSPQKLWWRNNGSTQSIPLPFSSQIPKLYGLEYNGTSFVVLGGGQELYTWTLDSGIQMLTIPPDSILGEERMANPNTSIGYSSVLTDIDGNGNVDWFVSAPTAGGGYTNGFHEQAGWVGWFEKINGLWVLNREWTGPTEFAHFGWSLTTLSSSSRYSIVVGSPKLDTVKELIAFEPTR